MRGTASDAQAFEMVKTRVTRLLERAAAAQDEGKSFDEVVECANEGMPIIVQRVAAIDLRELGHFSIERSGRLYKQWVYRHRGDPEQVYCISWRQRLMLQTVGFVQLTAFEDDQRKKN